jgi:acetolactate synthase I/II/III large subunit
VALDDGIQLDHYTVSFFSGTNIEWQKRNVYSAKISSRFVVQRKGHIMNQLSSPKDFKLPQDTINVVTTQHSEYESTDLIEAGDLLIAYLRKLEIDFVFGIPGGAIEPLYNALARSEKDGGPRPVVSRHESGAVFMADGYFRNSGKLGVCCTTTGPGATNAITGIATAYENQIPILLITAQTSLNKFGRHAFQESSDTTINTIGMFEHCTRYNTLVSHIEQLETKLVTAIMTAFGSPRGPVHLSIPLDILRHASPVSEPSYDIATLIKPPNTVDKSAVDRLSTELLSSRKTVFVLGSGCSEAVENILNTAKALNAKMVTTPDGKGLVSPYHPLFKGVLGFGGHQSANNLLASKEVELVVAVGTTISEWTSNGWDKETLLSDRLIHIDATQANLIRSPMARLHVRGHILTVFQQIESLLRKRDYRLFRKNPASLRALPIHNPDRHYHNSTLPCLNYFDFTLESPQEYLEAGDPIKPQWLMGQLTKMFPPHTKFFADTGNSFAWAVHYLHPFDRRLTKRRQRNIDNKDRRHSTPALFQAAMEFSSMGWAIGSAIGAALASPNNPIVAITGDGSWLMSGQEITTAVHENLPVIYVILNDSSLGMVKHGQRLSGAEQTSFELPSVNFCDMANSVGAQGYLIESYKDLLTLDIEKMVGGNKPSVLDVRIDPEQVPPIGVRIKVLQESDD